MQLRLAPLTLLLSLGFAQMAAARPPLMPPQMLEACAGQGAGAACTFEMNGKLVEGNCAALPDQSLACRPGGQKKPGRKSAAPKAGNKGQDKSAGHR